MLISVSGTFASGKTTLVRRVCRQLSGVACVEEIATAARTTCPEFDWRLPDGRAYLFWAQLLAERARLRDGTVWLLDGSLIDVFAHARAFGHAIPDHWIEAVSYRYDKVFICDAENVEIDDNSVRETDPVLRSRIQSIVIDEAARYGSSAPVLLSGSVDRRADRLCAYLSPAVQSAKRWIDG